MRIESRDTSMGDMLQAHYFRIPKFQRPYSWDEENISDLWRDLAESAGSDYFIGSMVVFKAENKRLGVVDGQQRLTTITILMCVLRNAYDSIGEKESAVGLQQLVERRGLDNQGAYVLETETSFPFFQEHVQKHGSVQVKAIKVHSEEKALQLAKEILTQKVSESLEAIERVPSLASKKVKQKAKKAKLDSLRNSVLGLRLILVTLDDEDDAYVIFETLNTRGKDLSVTDLLKNLFTKVLRTSGPVDFVKENWGTMVDTLYRSNADLRPDTFLYHFWASTEASIPMNRLYAAMKETLTAKNGAAYLETMVDDAFLYRKVHEASGWNKNEAKIQRALAALQLFRLQQPAPAVLSLVRAYDSKVLKQRHLVEALVSIEKFHFAFTAVTSSRSSGGISGMYSSYARQIYSEKDPVKMVSHIQDFRHKLKSRMPTLDEFSAAFSEIRYTNSNSKQVKLVRYVLRGLAEAEGLSFPVDWEELTIEHLAPQASIGKEGWTEENVGQLGNLFLLNEKTNVQLGAKSFADKIAKLKRIQHAVPATILDKAEWTPELARERTKAVAKYAYETVWNF